MSSKNKKTDSGGGRKPRFPELPPKYSSSRELRNKAEKMRRDRLNKLIEEMRSLVPMICNKTKKSETTRSNILRLTANFLRVTRLFPQDSQDETLVHPENSFLGEGLPHLESMEGFFFILAEDGRILFVSENIDKFVGFSQIEMMGVSVYNFLHPADQAKMQTNLKKGSGETYSPIMGDKVGNSPQRALAPLKYEESPTPSPSGSTEDRNGSPSVRQSFFVRLREKPLAKNDTAQYEHMHVVGHLKNVDARANFLGQSTFIGVMRPVRDRPITELSLMESVQDQYLTRHLPDGRFIYVDHRISTVVGYLPSEVMGKSAFNFFCPEDLPWTTMAMRHMFASSNGEGTTVNRIITPTGEKACLQSRGFLEFNKTTNKIETFLCINTLIRPEDTEKYLNEQKERFSPFITEMQINTMINSKTHGITFSHSSVSSSLASKITKGSVASLDTITTPSSCSEVSVISRIQPGTTMSPPPLLPLNNHQDTQTSVKRPHPFSSHSGGYRENSRSPPSKRVPQDQPPIQNQFSGKRNSTEAGLLGNVLRQRRVKTDQFKTDQYKTDQYKADQFKTDQFKTDQFKTDQYKADQFKTDQYHYQSRDNPIHRVEEGRRVVVIEDHSDSQMSKVNFWGTHVPSEQTRTHNNNQLQLASEDEGGGDLCELLFPGNQQHNTNQQSRTHGGSSVIQMLNPPPYDLNQPTVNGGQQLQGSLRPQYDGTSSQNFTSSPIDVIEETLKLKLNMRRNPEMNTRETIRQQPDNGGQMLPETDEEDLLNLVNSDDLLFSMTEDGSHFADNFKDEVPCTST